VENLGIGQNTQKYILSGGEKLRLG
jgi:hypothetical protein